MKYWIVLLMVLGLWGDAQAQLVTPMFRNFTKKDGLPSNIVTALYEDSKGYLWVATSKGLLRYNGSNFLQVSDDNMLMHDLFEAPQGEIWFNAGRLITYHEDGKYVRYPLSKDVLKLTRGSLIQSPFFDEAGSSWFSIANIDVNNDPLERLETIFELNQKKGELTSHQLSEDPDAHRLGRCYWKMIGDQLIHTGRYKKQDNVPERKRIIGPVPFSPDTLKFFIKDMIRLKNGTYLAAATNALIHFDDSLTYFYGEHFLPPNSEILHLYEDSHGSIWLSTYGGVYCVDQQNFKDIDSYRQYFSEYVVTQTIQTQDGGYWFSTSNGGVFQVPSVDLQWLTWPEDEQKSKIEFMVTNGEKIYFSSIDGYVYQIDSSLIAKKLPIPHHSPTPAIFPFQDQVITSTRWMSTLDVRQRLARFVGEEPTSIAVGKIYFHLLQEDTDGNIWVADNVGGVFHINLADRRVQYDSRKYGFNRRCSRIEVSRDGSVWMLADQDVWKLQDSSFVRFDDIQKGLQEIDEAWNLREMEMLRDDRIVLYSPDSGIATILRDTIQLIRAGEEMGVGRESLIVKESPEAFWLLSQKKFIRFEWNQQRQLFEKRKAFSPDFMFPADAELTRAVCYNNRIWIATDKGIIRFDPQKNPSQNSHRPLAYITNLEANGVSYSSDSTIELPYYENRIIFTYEIVAYNNPDRIKSRYRLIGTDEPWQYTTDRRIRYTNLDPGKYIFEVESSNGEGEFQGKPEQMNVEIKPHFSQTWWFRFLAGGIVILVIFGAFRYATQQNNLRRIISELRYQALVNQMNPHFIFNAMSSISFLVRNQENDRASRYLGQFADLLRGVLERAENSFVKLSEEVEQVRQYTALEALQFNGNLEVEIEIDQRLMQTDLYIPPMLLQPCIENAVKHGIAPKGRGEILIHLLDGNDRVLVAIRDDGIGREAAKAVKKQRINKKRRSIGVVNTQERVYTLNRLYKLDIQMWTKDLFEEGQAAGTQVEFSFPKLEQIPKTSLHKTQYSPFDFRNHESSNH